MEGLIILGAAIAFLLLVVKQASGQTSAAAPGAASSGGGVTPAPAPAQVPMPQGAVTVPAGLEPAAHPPPSETIDPNDPSTWPNGDAIGAICHAIALAEGYNVAGSAPQRYKNPGDLGPGDAPTMPSVGSHGGSELVAFPTHTAGWDALYQKVLRMVNGQSSVYSPYDTWQQVAQKYAGNWQAWMYNVTNYLGVDPQDTIGDYAGTL